jgi:lipopolysaccharide/colanic/teichoic acid biosynthesis glycosyltransferase
MSLPLPSDLDAVQLLPHRPVVLQPVGTGRSDSTTRRVEPPPGIELEIASWARLPLLIKRAMDVVLAVLGLIVLSPVFAVVMLAILISDGRPVFFRQTRAGLGGRPFVMLKFRTMVRHADAMRADLRQFNEVAGQASFKMTNDPRVTRFGAILRRLSIDELPQLWNVACGQMSLVGPRPHPFDDVAGYHHWHWRRLTAKPGITGLWQVSARSDPDFDRWVQLDLEYIENWSLRLDLAILVKTIPALLRGEGR